MTASGLFPEDWDNGPGLPSGSSAQGSCCGIHCPVTSVDSGAPGSSPISQPRVCSKSTAEPFWEPGVSHPRETCEEGISGKVSLERRLSIFLYPRLPASQLKNLKCTLCLSYRLWSKTLTQSWAHTVWLWPFLDSSISDFNHGL